MENNDRFRIVCADTAYEEGYPGAPKDWEGEYFNCVYEFDREGNPIRYVGDDSVITDAPEDATFCRDFDWVVDEMNRLSREVECVRAAGVTGCKRESGQ